MSDSHQILVNVGPSSSSCRYHHSYIDPGVTGFAIRTVPPNYCFLKCSPSFSSGLPTKHHSSDDSDASLGPNSHSRLSCQGQGQNAPRGARPLIVKTESNIGSSFDEETPESEDVAFTEVIGTVMHQAKITQAPQQTEQCKMCMYFNNKPRSFHGKHELRRHADRHNSAIRGVQLCYERELCANFGPERAFSEAHGSKSGFASRLKELSTERDQTNDNQRQDCAHHSSEVQATGWNHDTSHGPQSPPPSIGPDDDDDDDSFGFRRAIRMDIDGNTGDFSTQSRPRERRWSNGLECRVQRSRGAWTIDSVVLSEWRSVITRICGQHSGAREQEGAGVASARHIHYGANYNAVAHSPEVHSSRYRNKCGDDDKESEGRGGIGEGGNKPSIDVLIYFHSICGETRSLRRECVALSPLVGLSSVLLS